MQNVLKRVDRPASLHESVQAAILDFIRGAGLRPQQLLPPEAELARQLGVGRNSVREAIKALESIGVVETLRGTGVRVASFSFAPLLDKLPYALMDGSLRELSELLDLRRVVESGMIERAVGVASEPDIQALERILEGMRAKAASGETFPEEDREFHRTLFAPLGNQTLLKLLDVFWLAFTKTMQVIDIHDPDPMKTYEDHAVIVAAVAARDAARAADALIHRHYAGIASRIREARADP